MQQVTEQQILAMAPNAAAAANGKKISQKGGFVRRQCSADGTFYMGECTGSGKSNYITSVDFLNGAPVCRCSCPSRQFPCKHGLALLYEIQAAKAFEPCEIPEDILKKRKKIQEKEAKAQTAETPDGEMSGEAAEKAQAKKKAAAKSSKAARTKKIRKQLEGLELLEKLVKDLLGAGLGTMGGTSLGTYRELSKQLGDYYLPGPQRYLNMLILEMEQFRKDGQEQHYDASIGILEILWSLVRKSRAYLDGKLENDDVSLDDNILYEELGGIWKISELEEIGLSLKDAGLIQLAFWEEEDAAGRQFIDTGCWADLAGGEIYMTYNYRPVKALKYIRQEDTVFGVAEVPSAVYYPGAGNRRIRWENAVIREVRPEDLKAVRQFASSSLKTKARDVKNILKDPLAGNRYICLLSFQRIGKCRDGLVLQMEDGDTILLGDMPEMEASCERLMLLPDASLLEGQVLLGAFYHDAGARRLKLQPLSIITQTEVVRLLY